jgi:hypothetical protein
MDVLLAYQEVDSYRAAAGMCGTTPKTVRRIVDRQLAGGQRPQPARRGHNYDAVTDLVAEKVAKTAGRISVVDL